MSDIDLPRLLLESHRVLASELAASLEERGYPDLRPGHSAGFMHIDRRSGTRTTELARRARVTKQGMMLVVDDLESRGYVRRVPDPDDARAKAVKLTAHGRRTAGRPAAARGAGGGGSARGWPRSWRSTTAPSDLGPQGGSSMA